MRGRGSGEAGSFSNAGVSQSLFYLGLCMGSLIIVLLTTRSVAIPGAPHCRRWAEASGVATGARYAGTPVRLADKADVVKPPSAGEPLYCNAYLQVVSVKQALNPGLSEPAL